MKLLKLIAVLLDYPAEELWSHADELRAAIDDPALSAQRRVALLDFVDTLPRSPVGKVLKKTLREPYWVGHERKI